MNDNIEALLTKIEHNTRRRPEITLEFKMNTNKKRFPIDPPISLHEGNYCMGLISLSVYNTIFNITSKNNHFKYLNGGEGISSPVWKTIIIPPGAYEIEQINEAIQDEIKNNGDMIEDDDMNEEEYAITIEANDSTQKTKITCASGYQIDFTDVQSIGKLLGFNARILKEESTRSKRAVESTFDEELAGEYASKVSQSPAFWQVTSDKVVDIMPIDKIHLNCDKVEGSILNGKPSSILYSFQIDKSPGYKIIKNPETILYKNMQTDKIEVLEFYLLDDDGNEVDFNNETITFTLQIIRK